jgi:ACS family tartrate transporter-like MFS transporter
MSTAAPTDIPESLPLARDVDVVRGSALTKSAWRLVPLLAAAYVLNYLDRTNIGFAALVMNRDLGLTFGEFSFASGVFYVGYIVLAVPSCLALCRYRARRWLAGLMIAWGLVSAATALASGPISLSLLRFAAGAAQAGFLPGVIYYFATWFPRHYLTHILAYFLLAIPLSSVIAGPLAVAFLQMEGIGGLYGWQWLFVLEGLPAVLLGLAALRTLADDHDDADWLTPAEHAKVAAEVADEQARTAHITPFRALVDVRVLILTVIFFFLIMGTVGPTYWMPLILKAYGLTGVQAGWVTAAIYLTSSIAMIVWTLHIDRVGGHLINFAIASLVAAAGLALSVALKALSPALIGLTLALAGVSAARADFYSIPTRFLSGAAAACSIAFIIAVANLGGFAGPFVLGWMKEITGSFSAGLYSLAGALALAGAIALFLRAAVHDE